MRYLFFIAAILALTSGHAGAFFFILGLTMLYYAKGPTGERMDLIAGFFGCTALSIALWLVESF